MFCLNPLMPVRGTYHRKFRKVCPFQYVGKEKKTLQPGPVRHITAEGFLRRNWEPWLRSADYRSTWTDGQMQGRTRDLELLCAMTPRLARGQLMEESNTTSPAQSFKMQPKSLVTNFQCFMLLLSKSITQKKKPNQEKKAIDTEK